MLAEELNPDQNRMQLNPNGNGYLSDALKGCDIRVISQPS